MSIRKFSTLTALVLFSSCENKDLACMNAEKSNCGFSDPLIEIAFLRDWKTQADADCNEVCRTSIVQGKYKGQVVFFTSIGGPLCDPIFQADLFDCCGDKVKTYGYNDFQKFDAEVTERTILYTCTP